MLSYALFIHATTVSLVKNAVEIEVEDRFFYIRPKQQCLHAEIRVETADREKSFVFQINTYPNCNIHETRSSKDSLTRKIQLPKSTIHIISEAHCEYDFEEARKEKHHGLSAEKSVNKDREFLRSSEKVAEHQSSQKYERNITDQQDFLGALSLLDQKRSDILKEISDVEHKFNQRLVTRAKSQRQTTDTLNRCIEHLGTLETHLLTTLQTDIDNYTALKEVEMAKTLSHHNEVAANEISALKNQIALLQNKSDSLTREFNHRDGNFRLEPKNEHLVQKLERRILQEKTKMFRIQKYVKELESQQIAYKEHINVLSSGISAQPDLSGEFRSLILARISNLFMSREKAIEEKKNGAMSSYNKSKSSMVDIMINLARSLQCNDNLSLDQRYHQKIEELKNEIRKVISELDEKQASLQKEILGLKREMTADIEAYKIRRNEEVLEISTEKAHIESQIAELETEFVLEKKDLLREKFDFLTMLHAQLGHIESQRRVAETLAKQPDRNRYSRCMSMDSGPL